MNKKRIVLLMTIFSISALSADLIKKNGHWYAVNKRTGIYEDVFNRTDIADPRYRERTNPYQKDSQYSSFGSDRSYVDQTNRDMGNRP